MLPTSHKKTVFFFYDCHQFVSSICFINRHFFHSLMVISKHLDIIFIFLQFIRLCTQERIQADRDDPSLPLVTAPFGHASQV
jgi:hypothetical protein